MINLHSLFGRTISRIASLFFFVLILIVLNVFNDSIDNETYHAIVTFLNDNIFLFIIINVIFFVVDLFRSLTFPLNLPAPLFGAFGVLFILSFFIHVIGLIDTLLDENLLNVVNSIKSILYPLFFILALLSGYIELFIKETRSKRLSEKRASSQ